MPEPQTEALAPLTALWQQIVNSLPNLLAAAAIFVTIWILAGLIRHAMRLAARRRKMDSGVIPLLTNGIYWFLILLGLTSALQQLGIDVLAIVAGLGIAGFMLGFALQDVSKNFISGLLLLVEQPFKIGDSIDVNGFAGTVTAIDLRATELRTFDGRVVLIPNADVFTRPITNITRARTRRVELNIGIPYGSNLEAARQAALQAVAAIPGLVSNPAPNAVFQNFGDAVIDLVLYYWFDTSQSDLPNARDAGLVAVEAALKGIQVDLSPRQIVLLEGSTG
jgi:small conductance mechanosensitive channel